MKYRLLKLGAATAISVTGLGTMSSLKQANASTFKTAIKRVKIKYLPGKGVRIWTNYNSGRFLGYQAKDGTEWNVVRTAVDKQGKLWYMVGDSEWIEARYTVEVKQKESSQAKNTEKKVKKAKKIVNKTVKQTKKSTASQAPTNVDALVNFSKAQVGKSYVWGATGPNSFDCSGLVQYVYQKTMNKTLPRTTYDQVNVGKTVSMNSLKKGDLLFWGSTKAPYHVAIYVGNNQYVNAATPDKGVILQTLSSYNAPSIAKRVL